MQGCGADVRRILRCGDPIPVIAQRGAEPSRRGFRGQLPIEEQHREPDRRVSQSSIGGVRRVVADMNREPPGQPPPEDRHRPRRTDEVAHLPTRRVVKLPAKAVPRQGVVATVAEINERERPGADSRSARAEQTEESARRGHGRRAHKRIGEGNERVAGIMTIRADTVPS